MPETIKTVNAPGNGQDADAKPAPRQLSVDVVYRFGFPPLWRLWRHWRNGDDIFIKERE